MLSRLPMPCYIIPRPAVRKNAPAAATESIQPGKGYFQLLIIMVGRTMHIGTEPLCFRSIRSPIFFVKVYVFGYLPMIPGVAARISATGIALIIASSYSGSSAIG